MQTTFSTELGTVTAPEIISFVGEALSHAPRDLPDVMAAAELVRRDVTKGILRPYALAAASNRIAASELSPAMRFKILLSKPLQKIAVAAFVSGLEGEPMTGDADLANPNRQRRNSEAWREAILAEATDIRASGAAGGGDVFGRFCSQRRAAGKAEASLPARTGGGHANGYRAPDADPERAWAEAVAAEMAKPGMTRQRAVAAVVNGRLELHRAYVAAVNEKYQATRASTIIPSDRDESLAAQPRQSDPATGAAAEFAAAVKAKVDAGKKRAQAVSEVVRERPTLHAQYLREFNAAMEAKRGGR